MGVGNAACAFRHDAQVILLCCKQTFEEGEMMKQYNLERLCRTADTKLGRDTRRMVTEGRSSGFAARLSALLDQAQQIRDAGDLPCAFAYSLHLYFLAERREVEDSLGDFWEAEKRFAPFWAAVYEDAGETLREEMLQSFLNLLRMEEIPDEKKYRAAEFVFSHFSQKPHAESLLQLTDDVWHSQIIRGNNRAFDRPAGYWTAGLRLLQGEAERSAAASLIAEFGSETAERALQLFEKSQDVPLAYCILTYFADWIGDRNSQASAAGTRLPELEQAVPESCRAFFAFLGESPEAVDRYDEWEKTFPKDLWPLLARVWYQHVSKNREALAQRTGDAELIFRAADKGFWGTTKIADVEALDPKLRDHDPWYLLGLYYIAFDVSARRFARGREQYRRIAEKLDLLGRRTDLPDAKKAQKVIFDHLMEEMERFPAFLEELGNRFPDLAEAYQGRNR